MKASPKLQSLLNMDSDNVGKTRRPRRSKADIEDAIHRAAVSQIKKKGFSLALVTDIVKRAKIEPIVFYNRYKNLDEFYDQFVKEYDYWLTDLVRDDLNEANSEEGFSNLLEKLMNNLLGEEIMTELLRWEIAEGNHITERTARLREMHAAEMTNTYLQSHPTPDYDIVAITSLLVGGIYYMILHKDRSSLGGIDINTNAGKRRVIKAIRAIASMLFHNRENSGLVNGDETSSAEDYRYNFEKTCRQRVDADFRDHVEELMSARQTADRERIAQSLRKAGVSDEVINSCIASAD